MKTLLIPAIRKNLNITLSTQQINKLPKKLLLLYSIQYKELAQQVKQQLTTHNIQIPQTKQVLGCSTIKNPKKLPILLVTTGTFHSINLYTQAPEIYLLKNNQIEKIPQKQIKTLKIQRKTALMKFLSAENIGILSSTKPGQNKINLALKLKKKIEKKYKNQKSVFLFISDNIDIFQLENFPIQSWVNTACPQITVDKTDIINYSELPF